MIGGNERSVTLHIETIKTFCDLVETGSFSRAATLNFISQSAVSQQIRSLEERYNRQLIERVHRRNIAPTEAGRMMYEEFKEIVLRFYALDARLRASSETITGVIRVATVYSVGLYGLPPFVKQFIRMHPQVKINVEYGRTDKVYEACRNQTIDLGMIALPLRKPSLEVIPFRDERLVLVCSPNHPVLGKVEKCSTTSGPRRLSLTALAGEDFVAFERDIPTRKTIDRILRQHGVTIRPVMEFDNIETIKRSVEVGNGISILPERAVENEVKAGLLVANLFEEGDFTRPIGIIHRRGKVFSPATSAFIQLLTSGEDPLITSAPDES